MRHQIYIVEQVNVCSSDSPDIETNRHDGVEDNSVRQEDKDGSHGRAYSHTLVHTTTVHGTAGNEVFPWQIDLEPVSYQRLPEPTADCACQARAQQEYKDLQHINSLPQSGRSSSSSSSSLKFLEWPKQQRHHEDHYSQSKYSR